MNHFEYEVVNAVLAGIDTLAAVHADRRLEMMPAEVDLLQAWAGQLRAILVEDSPEHLMEKEHPGWPDKEPEFKCPFHKTKKAVG